MDRSDESLDLTRFDGHPPSGFCPRKEGRSVETTLLGRTGLTVSVAGLGCGGYSRLGQQNGASVESSVAVVRRAIDIGINYIDTAPSYGTEEIVGRGIGGRRDHVILSTKSTVRKANRLLTNKEIRRSLENSLRRLGTDYVDVFHLHGVDAKDYEYSLACAVPELLSMRDQGLLRYIAISERFYADTTHVMLGRAIADDVWDVMMLGFNFMNPSARRDVLPGAMDKNLGIEIMFAVRHTLAHPHDLAELVAKLVNEGYLSADDIDLTDPLGFLIHGGGAESTVDAAYRFCRHEPGCHVVLTGTGNVAHLEYNVRSLNRGPLPEPVLARLTALFGKIDHITAGGRAPRPNG
jgi:L-galactose dehydrogenase